MRAKNTVSADVETAKAAWKASGKAPAEPPSSAAKEKPAQPLTGQKSSRTGAAEQVTL